MVSSPGAVLPTRGGRRGTVVVLAVLVGLAVPRGPAPSRAPGGDAARSVEGEIARRFDLVVRDGDLSWESGPARGLGDALWGTRVLFLGARRQGGPRDLYRADVRLTPAGHVLSLSSPINVSRTAIGDDHGLVVGGPFAAYATSAYGGVQAVTILDLRGEPDEALALLDRPARALRVVTDWMATGTVRGIGRTVVRLDVVPDEVTLRWSAPSHLTLTPRGRAAVTIDASNARGREGDGTTVDRVVHDAQPFVLWAVDTVRAVVGPAPIAWLEARTFAVADMGRRLEHGAMGSEHAARAAAPRLAPRADALVGWPPPPIAARMAPAAPGEGTWQASAPAFVKRLAGAPPAFQETFLRPDPARPYVRVHLVAMDMRQLVLGVVAGAEDPEPTVGPPGTGRLPHDRAFVESLVGAFNGAFKTKHGEYGLIQARRILLPPMRDAATIVSRADGRLGIGSWPGGWHVSPDIVSLRQNLDPLVDHGVLNPRRRRLWGFPLPGMEDMMTHRSGLCVDRGGNLLYFFGTDLSGPLLGEAMLAASCSYGIHLDMNPMHCAFVYAHIRDPDAWLAANDRPGRAGALAELFDAHTATREMMDPKRYLVRSPKDFFTLTLRPALVEHPSYRLDGGPL